MVKKPITYTDYDGIIRTEDFYFGLNKAELIEMEATTEGGFTNRIETATKAKDMPTIMRIFKEFIRKSIGKKGDDGKTFYKSEKISDDFEACPAYETLFMELVTDADKARKFLEDIMPPFTDEQKAQISEQMKKISA